MWRLECFGRRLFLFYGGGLLAAVGAGLWEHRWAWALPAIFCAAGAIQGAWLMSYAEKRNAG